MRDPYQAIRIHWFKFHGTSDPGPIFTMGYGGFGIRDPVFSGTSWELDVNTFRVYMLNPNETLMFYTKKNMSDISNTSIVFCHLPTKTGHKKLSLSQPRSGLILFRWMHFIIALFQVESVGRNIVPVIHAVRQPETWFHRVVPQDVPRWGTIVIYRWGHWGYFTPLLVFV